ncbi:YkvI family membrane protein [Senegalia massiliensis]|uniref:Uncharacterized protein n=1 Tax=Senegalia massiliensis TaxID=1720316 RepID=A0A845QYI1_9CLOT|nr:hypothetical protein [Senegalia massiliensis]NBI06576.1 hypothetical protein [Senegalia massiliensis]
MDRNSMKAGFIYIGTIIGAGFASGKEISYFFGIYGTKGIYGVLITSILFSIIPMIILYRIKQDKIKSYDDLLQKILGRRFGDIVDKILSLYLFISYSIMISGGATIIKERLHINFIYGIIIMSFLTLIVFLFSMKGLSYANSILIPILIVGIVVIGFLIINNNGLNFSNNDGINITKNGNWVTSAILYVSYNSLSSIVILVTIESLLKTKKQIIKVGLFGGSILGLMALFILIPILIKYTDILGVEVPMLIIASNINSLFLYIYAFIILSAMFTTAIGSGFSLITRINKETNIKKNILAFILPLLSFPLSYIGFSNLISTLYPLFGYLGLFIILFIVIENLCYLCGLKGFYKNYKQ